MQVPDVPLPHLPQKTICRSCQWISLQIIRLILPVLKFYFSIYQLFCLNVNTINKSMVLHNIHVNVFASVTHLCFFFFHQVVQKPFKFINNVLQTNENFLNESNFPSFLSFCAFILDHSLGKCPNNFFININVY